MIIKYTVSSFKALFEVDKVIRSLGYKYESLNKPNCKFIVYLFTDHYIVCWFEDVKKFNLDCCYYTASK